MADPILDDLTPPQREAVAHVDGPMLVVAGAGSGKTRVVTRRIAHLIRAGVPPHRVLAMTFTNKAAGEMRERVERLTGAAPAHVGTFHSLCARFLRYDLDALGEGRSGRFTIFDDDDQQGLVKQVLRDLEYDDKRFRPRSVLSAISRAKCDLTPPEEFDRSSYQDEVIAKVYAEYESRLRQMDAVDFDDLLVLTVRLLEARPEVRQKYLRRFSHLLIDEYQDTNRTQYRLMRLLAGPEENVHATGDPDQSIYSWRGADYRNIMDFQNDFPDARLVRLEQNYRSTPTILAAANALIRHNENRIAKDLFTEKPDGEKVLLACLPDDRAEAAWVAERVHALREEGLSLRSVAVFYRTNAQSRSFEEAFLNRGVPYQIVGGIRFYQRKEIKDFLAHLKVMVNPRDALALRRVVECRPTGVGATTLAKVLAQAAAAGEAPFPFLCREDFPERFEGRTTKKLRDFAAWCRELAAIPRAPVGACVESVLKHSGLALHLASKADRDPASADRVENLDAFLNRAYEFEAVREDADLALFLEDVALVADVDQWDPDAEQLSLMTLHSAKGLEFPAVFLVGLEDGLLPHHAAGSEAGKEEERRLFYVGLTRAQERVFLSHANYRMQHGRVEVAVPSVFLDELPEEHLAVETYADPFAADAPAGPWGGGRSGGGGRDGRGRAKGGRFGDAEDDGLFPDDGLDPFDGIDEVFEDEPASDTPAGGFRTGDLVNHHVFGKGKVLALSGREAVVQFFTGGTRRLHLETARLRRG